jgi:NADH-quinone oxidoreductase subunit M
MRTRLLPLPWLLAIVVSLVAWLAAAPGAGFASAWASPSASAASRAAGHIVLALPGGRRGPLVLTPGQGGWVGTFTIFNQGADPLIVSRVAIRGDEDDVRSPSRLSVRFVDGPVTSTTLAPNASKDVVVSWMPDRDPRVRQAFGHVVVTSTDEESGEVAMGFRAQVPTGLGWVGEHVLTLLAVLPLFIVFVAAGARLAGRSDDPIVRRASWVLAVVELLLALWAYQRFSPDMAHADGNDGFQLVERAAWVRSIGAEWYVGVDGVSVALVVLAAALGLAARVVVPAPERRSDAYETAMALLSSGVVAALVALDLVVLFAAWQLVLVALVMLVGGWGGARGEHAAAKLATYGAVGSSAMLAAFVALSRASGPALLVDGTAVAHTLSIPELARTSFAAQGSILGVPFVEAVWALLFVAAAVATPLVPLHGWLPDALEEAPAGASMVLAGVVVALGPYLLVRVGLGAMPEGARWAGPSMAAVGVLAVAYGSLCAMAQTDLRRFVAYVSIASGGASLFGVGVFTPQGMAGAVTGLFAHGLAAAILLGVAGALRARARTCDLTRLAGVFDPAPRLAALLAAGLALSLGVPGLAGFWGLLLVLLGGFVRHPVLAALLAGGLVASAAAHLRVARLLLLGRTPLSPGASAPARDREPLAVDLTRPGRLPDASPRELAVLVPLAGLGLLLGLWPVPLLSQIADGVRDASAVVDASATDLTVEPR